ncbi:MAG TPA: glycosyltransferase family 2 protein [Candidatus Avidesulfovibrio excrementigallinarum]|nr:glycosyltransferase family 2 protein [Candidatus Avidesulfovibrio excrementigallinarum]
MFQPVASLIMPLYNTGPLLHDTVASVLAQTFRDFELILVDDSSTDDTVKRAQAISDPRVRLIRRAQNGGVAAATNDGYAAARGRYIVPADHDDVLMPGRLACEIAFLEAHPELDGVGAGHVILSRSNVWDKLRAMRKACFSRHIPYTVVSAASLWGGILFNSTLCFRRSVLDRVPQWWDSHLSVGSDDEFFGRIIAAGCRFHILPDVVLRYRRYSGNLSRRSRERSAAAHVQVALEGLARVLPDATEEERTLHCRLALRDRTLQPADLVGLQALFERMHEAVTDVPWLDEKGLLVMMARHWSRACALAACHDFRAGLHAYYSFPLLRPYVGSLLFILSQWQKRQTSAMFGH